jgi:hypothetical protein
MIEQPKKLSKLEREALARKVAMKAYQNDTGDQEVSGEQHRKFQEVWDRHYG